MEINFIDKKSFWITMIFFDRQTGGYAVSMTSITESKSKRHIKNKEKN
jgi:hypothetical protein